MPHIGLTYYKLDPWVTVFEGIGQGSASGRHPPETSDVIPELLDPWQHVGSTTVAKEGEELWGPSAHSTCTMYQPLPQQKAIHGWLLAVSTDNVVMLRMPVPAPAENAAYHAHMRNIDDA